MKNLYFLFLFTPFALSLNAQNLITVQHGSTATFYTDLQASITAAQDGDYIYIPGGAWGLNNQIININKRLNIYGAGALVDSSSAIGISFLNYNFRFNSGSSNSIVSGCKFATTVVVGYDTCVQNVNNIVFQSNHFLNTLQLFEKCGNAQVINNVILECNINGSQNFNLSNNIIYGHFRPYSYNSTPPNGSVSNCFINNLGNYSQTINAGTIVFKNNFINGYTSYANLSFNSCIFINNFTTFSFSSFNISNTYINNQIVTLSSIFTNVPSGNSYGPSNNYHIITSSPAHNAGEDGTDIGIYGGTNPWKEGLVPANPHIRFSNINSQTGAGGNLPVNIKVGAQDN